MTTATGGTLVASGPGCAGGGSLKQAGVKLRAEKGNNLPDTDLDLPVPGQKDL